jgi:hypothetical protein
VLPAKEHASLKPHGQILRTGERLVPDEAALTSTVWMGGVFHSMITQGHVSINRMLSTTRSYLGLLRAPGLRIFIEVDGGWQLLGVPSAFAMTPSSCRWLYAHPGGVVAIESGAALGRHALTLAIRVLEGAPCRFLLSHPWPSRATTARGPCRSGGSETRPASSCGPIPRRISARASPRGFSGSIPARARRSRVAGDEALFSTAARGRSRSSRSSPSRPRTRASR